MFCISCGKEIPVGSVFCAFCGKPQTIAGCKFCGQALPEGAMFCPKCGKKQDGVKEKQDELDLAAADQFFQNVVAKKQEQEENQRLEAEMLARFEIKDNCLVKYKGNDADVVIPDSVTSIGEYAFYRCTNLRNITIPNSVASIGDAAFWGCINLQGVTIPNGVTSIGEYAFNKCTSLRNITISNGVTSIEDCTL